MKKKYFFLLFFISCILYGQPISLAVFDLELIGNVPPTIGKAFPEILRTKLAMTGDFAVLERAQLEKVLEEQKFTMTALVDKATVAHIGELVGAQFVMTGSIIRDNSSYTINVRLINVSTGMVKFAEGVKLAGGEELSKACNKIVKELSDQIVKSKAEPQEELSTPSSKGNNFEKVVLTGIGLIILVATAIVLF